MIYLYIHRSMKPGDFISQIRGKTTLDLPLPEMKRLILGPAGSVVDLEIHRSLPGGQEDNARNGLERELIYLERGPTVAMGRTHMVNQPAYSNTCKADSNTSVGSPSQGTTGSEHSSVTNSDTNSPFLGTQEGAGEGDGGGAGGAEGPSEWRGGVGISFYRNRRGIFMIKQIVVGGSAFKSNKLLVRDALVAVNGEVRQKHVCLCLSLCARGCSCVCVCIVTDVRRRRIYLYSMGGGGGLFVLNGRRRKIYLYPMVLWHEERLTIQIARAHT